MNDLLQIWQATEELIAQGNYHDAIAELNKIKKYSSHLQPEELVRLKKTFIKLYEKNGKINQAKLLCNSLSHTNNQELKRWVKDKLESLNNSVLSSESISHQKSNNSSEVTDNNLDISAKTVQDFKEFARDNILETLRIFEKKRTVAIISIIVATIIFLVTIYYILQGVKLFEYIPSYNIKFKLLIVIIIGLIFTTGCWITFIQSTIFFYSNGFRRKVIEPILYFISPCYQLVYFHKANTRNMMYSNRPLINVSINNSNLFSQDSEVPYYIEQEDCVQGKINDVHISWSKVSIAKIAGYDYLGIVKSLDIIDRQLGITNNILKILVQLLLLPIKSFVLLLIPFVFLLSIISPVIFNHVLNHFKSQLTLGKKVTFNGLFFEASFPKNFRGQTFLMTNNLISIKLHDFGQSDKDLVRLEDREFNRIFSVYSTDQVEARYILSTNLMRSLIDFYYKVKKPIKISFNQGNIYIAIAYDYDIFEPRLFKSMLSFAPLKEYFETLQFMLNIVQELNLNRQIWGQFSE